MTYSDDYNIRTKNVKFNDVADAIDGVLTRSSGGVTTGTSTAYISTPSPSWTSYATGGLLTIVPHVTNSASATLNVSGLGAVPIRRNGVAITAGIFAVSSPVLLVYNGAQFDVIAIDPANIVTIPVGQITAFGGSSAPSGWLLCNGAEYPIATYPALSGVLGTTYNLGTETLNYFRVPDLTRRVPIGDGPSDVLGNAEGGTKAGTAYASRSMTHSHTVPAHYHGMGAGADLAINIAHTHSSSSVSGTVGGSDGTHRHSIPNRSGNANIGSAGVLFVVRGGNTSQGGSTGADLTGTDEGGHSHGHNLTAAGQTLSATNVGPNTGTRIGLVTGGVDGNIQQSTGPITIPHLFVNYIIKT